VTEGVTLLSRPVPVSAHELARWLGSDTTIWLERLAASGELPAVRDRKGYSFDPRVLHHWVSEHDKHANGNGSSHGVDLGSLRDLSQSLVNVDRPDSVCRRVLGTALDVLEAESGAIFLSDEDAWLDLVAVAGIHDESLPEALQGAAIWVAANSEPLLLPDPRRAPGIVDLSSSNEPHDALGVPLILDGRVVGVLVALRRRDAPGFDDGDLSLATVLAAELALAVDRAGTQGSTGRRLTIAQDQLEAYATDVREVFAAEKQQAAALVDALGELERTYLATVRGLAAAVEAKDEYTAGHLYRVSRYGMAMLELMGPRDRDDPKFEYGFLLHDVGKLGIPDAILSKRGSLSRAEWALMKKHPQIGVHILRDIPFLSGALEVVCCHHERWDGTGYPNGTRGGEIPFGARLFAVADAFDAMTTDRPYRSAMSIDSAIIELRRKSGSQFWPEAVDALLSIPRKMLEETAVSGNGHRRA
jgi:HD-GYP domain-containing protein (c-di-GMP phosphodiesterase class II)